jgi:hypothetical protein
MLKLDPETHSVGFRVGLEIRLIAVPGQCATSIDGCRRFGSRQAVRMIDVCSGPLISLNEFFPSFMFRKTLGLIERCCDHDGRIFLRFSPMINVIDRHAWNFGRKFLLTALKHGRRCLSNGRGILKLIICSRQRRGNDDRENQTSNRQHHSSEFLHAL